jgi:hypothetical protein
MNRVDDRYSYDLGLALSGGGFRGVLQPMDARCKRSY